MKALLIVTIAVFAGIESGTATAGERLQLVERPLNETLLDLGAKGDSAGDLLTFANPVFDADNKIQRGTAQGYCIRVIAGKSWECYWTLTLKEGQITVEGPYSDTGDSLLVVTGGTGRYVGAKGQLTLHPKDEKHSTYLFTYELL
jgi:allene oxide cyclase